MSKIEKATRRLPAEWERQSAIMLTWPHEDTDWQEMLPEVEKVYLEIAHAVLKEQDLLVVCPNDSKQKELELRLTTDSDHRAIFHIVDSNDTWARDHGALTVTAALDKEDTRHIVLDFQFNGWGDKFESELDNNINKVLHRQGAFIGHGFETIDFILEGGSIESDGRGTIITTSQCLLAPTRNGGLSKTEVESIFAKEFGTKRVLWLDHGHLEGDDTDAHVDTLARFCDENTICYVQCSDTSDPHYASLKKMEDQLLSFRTDTNEPYKLVPLPMTTAIFDEEERLPATYANFLITNESVLLPTYDVPEDALAIEQVKGCFPNRNIIDIDCSALIKQHGSLHCITMQFPSGIIT